MVMLKYSSIVIAFFIATVGFSQEEDSYVYGDTPSRSSGSNFDSGFDWDKVAVGGNLGLQIGTTTFIELSPIISYYLTREIVAGVGANYTYFSDSRTNFDASVYGARVFAQYLFSDLPVLLHAELERINLPVNFGQSRLNINNTFIGGGIKQKISDRSYVFLLALWNLNQDDSLFPLQQQNPTVRGGFAISL